MMIIIRELGCQPYQLVWDKMKQFTLSRHETTPDECWLVEHPPVYTQGQAGKAEHILNAGDIPIVQTDRGGQVTFHGPGQLLAYVLIDLRKRKMGIRSLVTTLEHMMIALLADYGITANTQCKAPGVYVENKKIASIGLRVKNFCTYHGIALNVSMDLTPFQGINPCGFSKLEMTQIKNYINNVTMNDIMHRLKTIISQRFEE